MTTPEGLAQVFDHTFATLHQVREDFSLPFRPREIGVIVSVATGIAMVSGLSGIGFEELIQFPGDVLGIAFNVDEHVIGVVLLGDNGHLRAGDAVERIEPTLLRRNRNKLASLAVDLRID